jgi:hypothetical protein
MTGQDELIMFKRLLGAGGTQFVNWLAEKEAATVKIMALSEGAALHRAQGRYGFIDEMKKLLDASRELR